MLIDVWRSIGKEVYYLTHDTFQHAPSSPGVYAWYYPLKISTYDVDEFVNEINTVINYDAVQRGVVSSPVSLSFNWLSYSGSVCADRSALNLSAELRAVWTRLVNDQSRFRSFRENILRFTILMPPLYVGKTSNLLRRLRDHIDGRDGQNDFHGRFCDFAEKNSLGCRSVQDLLFVCVPTDETEEVANESKVAYLTEEIIKILARPPYSAR